MNGSHGNYLSKSAPIAAQAQAYLEHNVRSRGNQKRPVSILSVFQINVCDVQNKFFKL